MTREEAIAILQEKHDECKAFYDLAAHPEEAYPGTKEYMEALQMALAALCGPTREQVEALRGDWIDKPTGRYGQWQTWCSACGKHSGIGGIKNNRHRNFCPNCGCPQTDEAVDIVMKRLEELYGKAETD